MGRAREKEEGGRWEHKAWLCTPPTQHPHPSNGTQLPPPPQLRFHHLKALPGFPHHWVGETRPIQRTKTSVGRWQTSHTSENSARCHRPGRTPAGWSVPTTSAAPDLTTDRVRRRVRAQRSGIGSHGSTGGGWAALPHGRSPSQRPCAPICAPTGRRDGGNMVPPQRRLDTVTVRWLCRWACGRRLRRALSLLLSSPAHHRRRTRYPDRHVRLRARGHVQCLGGPPYLSVTNGIVLYLMAVPEL